MLVTIRPRSPHTFHVPVMGTGFTIDTALRIARYGISSVLSLVDDALIEQMRKFHAEHAGETYTPIPNTADDARAARITAYLNLLNRLVHGQFRELRDSAFAPGTDLTRYFELLPECVLKRRYREMLQTSDSVTRLRLESRLRESLVSGSIDVNIMSKNDRDEYRHGKKCAPEFSAASAALRGFAQSSLNAAIVFSAGMNPRLYNYAAQFDDFFPNPAGFIQKTIVLKVSDFRSAMVQGKFLAKKGLWISEYRIESGLNCGGHAFASDGYLMGPILAEFRARRNELNEELHRYYAPVWAKRGLDVPEPLRCRITVQGGIGTSAEDALLREYYGADATGWATPFLLVPEVTNVDGEHLAKLEAAGKDDVYLSQSSPFGLPFWNLRNSASELARRQRIEQGNPGSTCPKGYITTNSEFTTVPICTGSRGYQRRKLKELSQMDISADERERRQQEIMLKACICHDLAGSVTRLLKVDAAATPAICCGPNIVNFARRASLDEMVGHIYGRCSLLSNPHRPHMFITELELYLDFLEDALERQSLDEHRRSPRFFEEFIRNLDDGIRYYRSVANDIIVVGHDTFLQGLNAAEARLDALAADAAAAPMV